MQPWRNHALPSSERDVVVGPEINSAVNQRCAVGGAVHALSSRGAVSTDAADLFDERRIGLT